MISDTFRRSTRDAPRRARPIGHNRCPLGQPQNRTDHEAQFLLGDLGANVRTFPADFHYQSVCGPGIATCGTGWSGSLDITYNFTPSTRAETPLPAALPLFATGLGALGLLGWRRKRLGRQRILDEGKLARVKLVRFGAVCGPRHSNWGSHNA